MGERFSGKVAKYKDFRRMLDKEKSIDAVIVATPDHTHGVITAEVMKRGQHVYTAMPMAHDVWEIGQLMRIAKTRPTLASGLQDTMDKWGVPAAEMQALPDGADEKTTLYHEVFAAVVQEWWPR